MIIHETLKTKSIDEMTDFLYALCETDSSKCEILCNGRFCYKPAPHRACRQKLKEYLERNVPTKAQTETTPTLPQYED